MILGFAVVSISLSIVTSQFVFAASENWSEVTRFSGTGALTTTDPFTCDHVEWRIRWELEPQSDFYQHTFIRMSHKVHDLKA